MRFHTMQITWFRHSVFRLDFAGNAVLIDPFFTGNPAFVSDKAAAIKGVTQIVLTHGHSDHVGDTLDIAKTNGATVPPTTNSACGWCRRGSRNSTR
jgi:L-ascorbate metabolism protein UlaG (beta-lactamase superfamily)